MLTILSVATAALTLALSGGILPTTCPAQTAPARQTSPAGARPIALASTAPLPVSNVGTAPQLVQVRGVVRNSDGKPCPGASVYPAGSMRQLVITDAQGAFQLPMPAGSPVSLRVEYFGVGTSRVELPLATPELLTITLGQ